jgi:hypothetical protein
MIVISIVYFYDYKKKNRNMKILKIRFIVSTILIYPILAFYVYNLIIHKVIPDFFRFLPIFVVFFMLFLNAIVMYIFEFNNCD